MKRVAYLKYTLYCMILGLCGLGIYHAMPPQTKLASFSYLEKRWFRIRANKPISYIHENRLKEKIQQGLAPWALKQIQDDLSKFPTIRVAALEEHFKKNHHPHNRLVRFQVRAGQLSAMAHDPEILQLKSYRMMSNVFRYLAQKGYIRDTDFILSVQDYVVLQTPSAVPIFTFSKDLSVPLERDLILIPDWMNLLSIAELRPRIQWANDLFPWVQKKPILFWRGGIADSSGFRQKLVKLSSRYPQWIDAKFSQNNPELYLPEEQHVQYCYQITVDGARATWERLVWQLHSNSLVFKHQSQQIQWFYGAIHPGVHYLSVHDEADLLAQLAFAKTHPDEAQAIIHRANDFANENLSLEDMLHYIVVLLNEYSKRLTTS